MWILRTLLLLILDAILILDPDNPCGMMARDMNNCREWVIEASLPKKEVPKLECQRKNWMCVSPGGLTFWQFKKMRRL
uniref:Uncharacterized protein n=1 Tax=Candidatus Kentrum sp. FW TaxID=2126338 RepID=A0A450SUA7_9GAMM|nr:MAG: hypothetical protein BECKFW1821B_GA0114236_10354 [Candidatus Kentron sp. FW]